MDRFIELTLNAQKIFFDNLKSNMDRFIVLSPETILYFLFYLKSNMDRFIVPIAIFSAFFNLI